MPPIRIAEPDTTATTPDATTPVSLVTGANKGVGRGIAELLAERGHRVYLGCRDSGRGRATAAELTDAGHDAHALVLDVTDPAGVDRAARHIAEEVGRLDVLINNAGVSPRWAAPSATDPDELRAAFETNVVGALTVTNAMLPLLRRSPAARIVNVSSVLGSLGAAAERADPTGVFPTGTFPAATAYSTSKTALNAVTVAYANELRAEGILVNAVSPNYVATDVNGHTGTYTPREGALLPVEMAVLSGDGPTGTFTCTDRDLGSVPLPW